MLFAKATLATAACVGCLFVTKMSPEVGRFLGVGSALLFVWRLNPRQLLEQRRRTV